MLPHTVVVDYAVALLSASVACDLLALLAQEDDLRVVGYWTLLFGTLAAAFAALSGYSALTVADPSGPAREIVLRHRNLALATLAAFAPLATWRVLLRGRLPERRRALYWALALVALAMLVVTAWLGGTAVFRHGVGVRAQRPVAFAAVAARSPQRPPLHHRRCNPLGAAAAAGQRQTPTRFPQRFCTCSLENPFTPTTRSFSWSARGR